MFEKYLQEIGLSDKEALIYLALLQVDNASVIALAEKTKIKRPTVYVVLETLAKKGLVSETTIGKKVHYQAESPERLQTYVERQKILLEERSKRLNDIIPQIKSIQREKGERPVVRFFEGSQGIISANAEMFEGEPDGSPAYFVYTRDMLDDAFPPEERIQFRKNRTSKQIQSKTIYTYLKGDIPADSTSERIRVDSEKYPFYCDICIYKDRVRISILGDKLSGIFVKSKEFAETLKSLFGVAFDQMKKPR